MKKKKYFCLQHEKLKSLCCCCRYAGAGTRPFTCQNCGDALSLSWTSQPAPTWRPHTQTSSNRSSRGIRTTCSMSASRYEREGGSLRLQQFSDEAKWIFMCCPTHSAIFSVCCQVDSSRESAEAACDILSQLVNCSLKTLGLISTARPSFMEMPKVSLSNRVTSCAFSSKSKQTWHHKVDFCRALEMSHDWEDLRTTEALRHERLWIVTHRRDLKIHRFRAPLINAWKEAGLIKVKCLWEGLQVDISKILYSAPVFFDTLSQKTDPTDAYNVKETLWNYGHLLCGGLILFAAFILQLPAQICICS